MAETSCATACISPPAKLRAGVWVAAFSTLLLAISLHVMLLCPISPSPHPLQLPSPAFPLNHRLQEVTKLGHGFLEDPEDICVDTQGILYAATRDGWIKRLHPNGSWENWKNIHSRTLLGIAPSNYNQGGIIVCDADKGILKVNQQDGFSVLVSSHVNQTRIISFADDVVEAADGCLYFSDASSKFGLHNWYLDFLEAKPHGRLLKYDPSSNQISTLLDNLHFANGVALSADQHYVVVCETFKYRCVKYWLKGQKEGETEIFIDNLPGAPDNINLAPDGSFWIALIQPIRDGSELFVRSKLVRQIVASFPKLYELLNGARRRAMVVKVDADGRILMKLDDPNGKVISFVTSALEYHHHLYLGSLNANFLGVLPLTLP